jgi:hypothetical protein
MKPTTTYCTILARNYLAKALALGESLRAHHPGSELVILLIDHRSDDELPSVDAGAGAMLVSTAALGLPERTVLELAASYDLVEFATSIKPALFKRLLKSSDQVVYLDPDTYVTSPMAELTPALQASEGGIVLTPHFLEPVPPGLVFTEGHLLNVGVYNLGFCAVDRRSIEFLDWWWGHLQAECLHDPLAGLFVDQKWVDIGSTLFSASALRHYGYNVGIANLHERPVARDSDGYVISSSGDRLRLFHFHAFDSSSPHELTTRLDGSSAHLRAESEALDALCVEYAEILVAKERLLGEAPAYPYWNDTRGRPVSRHTRRVYRQQRLAGVALPSPYVSTEADAYDEWRRSARRQVARGLLGDAAKSIRLALPDEYARVKDRFPRLTQGFRARFVARGGIWG